MVSSGWRCLGRSLGLPRLWFKRFAERTGCPVYCHPKGAPHLADPHAKLLPSAERIYGEMMKPLWGTTISVPPGNVFPVEDGVTISVGDLDIVAWHTPGHAVHHVAWQIDDSIVTGDVAGVRFPGASRRCWLPCRTTPANLAESTWSEPGRETPV